MKKAIVLASCLIIIGFLAVNSTFAQGVLGLFRDMAAILSPSESAPRPASASDLDVKLVVHTRNAEGTALIDETALPYIQPAVYDSAFRWDTDKTPFHGYLLWDDSKLFGAVDKFVSVANLSENSGSAAYVRTVFALSAYAYEHQRVHLNFNRDLDRFSYSPWMDTTIGGRPYKMIVVTYLDAVEPGASTPPMLLQVAMSSSATSEDAALLGADFLQYKVLAAEANAFRSSGKESVDTALKALDLALPLDESFHPFQ